MKASTGNIFVYGTLMAPEVVQTLIRRLPAGQKASVEGFACHPVQKYVFPGLIEDASATTNGIYYEGLSVSELKRLDWFEDVEYTRKGVPVRLENQETRHTQVYLWANPIHELHLDTKWDYERFRRTNLDWYLQNTVQPCADELDRLGYE